MSYEVQALPDSVNSPVIPTTTQTMREERIIDPYAVRPTRLTGQPDIARVPEGKPEETVRLSPQVALLARREQKFRQQQQALERERTTLAAEKQEIAQLRAMKEKLEAKDYSGLDGLVDYNDYSQYQVNRLNGANPVDDEIKRLNGKISEIEKNATENISRQFEAAVSERRIATSELVDKTDQFPRIKKAKAHEAVVQHILDTWEHDSKELSIEQAAKEVESILLEKAQQWATLLAEDSEVEPPKKALPPLKQGLRTLTNQVTAGDVTKRTRVSLQHLSESDRWAEARKRAEEKLQNR
jgi:hypothetical protein